MLRKTMIVLATAAILSGALTADAVALATGQTGWDGLGDGGAHAIVPTPHRGGVAGVREQRPGLPPLHRKRGAPSGFLLRP
jgi:hypothetical protein